MTDASNGQDPSRKLAIPQQQLLAPNGQPMNRNQRRQYARSVEDLHRQGQPLERIPKQGDLRIVTCGNPDHPYHVHIYHSAAMDGAGEWVRCDDTAELPAAILEVMNRPDPMEQFEDIVDQAAVGGDEIPTMTAEQAEQGAWPTPNMCQRCQGHGWFAMGDGRLKCNECAGTGMEPIRPEGLTIIGDAGEEE